MTVSKIHFRRVPKGPVTEPGTYAQWQKNNSGLLAECCCPKGHGGTLRSPKFKGNHDVDDNGVVKPSYVCTEKGCDFHAWVVLDDWVPV